MLCVFYEGKRNEKESYQKYGCSYVWNNSILYHDDGYAGHHGNAAVDTLKKDQL